ncbi:MarR family winged helix-turn-helix transcriptional regulator [Kutzneria sp. NPDC052558]|uniref:MarR family winged helix-turn-helix transcriptional regulator n=1 Tax=Kutzneria sp. NPDC052558 TaxID=3364121 RepID=UPI0037C5EC89
MSDPVLAELGQATQDYQAAVEDYDRETARLLGVNGTDQRCLELLLGSGELTPRELAERLNLTTGSVTVMLDRLERLALLARAPHPSDRRKVTVRITEDGARRCLDLRMPLIEEGGREVAAKYDAAQLALVIDFLRTVTDIQRRHVDRLRDQPSPGR